MLTRAFVHYLNLHGKTKSLCEFDYLIINLLTVSKTRFLLCAPAPLHRPNNIEDYVHRIGRTGRAGAKVFVNRPYASHLAHLLDLPSDLLSAL